MRPRLLICTILLVWSGCYSTFDVEPDGGIGGMGGSGPCPSGQAPRLQAVQTELPCDLNGASTQCAPFCDIDCEEGEFDLGSTGSACARRADAGPACRCLCAECRPE